MSQATGATRIYRWHSTLLERYSSGDLIAAAESADAARRMIRAEFPAWAQRERQYWFYLGDDLGDFESAKVKLESDLAAEPEIHSVLFIDGSE